MQRKSYKFAEFDKLVLVPEGCRPEIVLVGSLVTYPAREITGGTDDDDAEVWSVSMAAGRPEFFLQMIDLGTVGGEELPDWFLAHFDAAISVGRPTDLTHSQAMARRTQLIERLKTRFVKVLSFGSEVEMVRACERQWPCKRTTDLRKAVETEKKQQVSQV